jgi:hypothetical protein
MARHFEVIGEDDEISGDVMGDVMGYQTSSQVVGYDDEGYPIVSGPRKRKIAISKPGWRQSTLAPGVIAPDQGLLTLPMGSFTFVAAAQLFTFQGQVQKPFRGERLLVTTVRTGTTAVGRIMGQIFVGSDLAALDVPPVDIEQLGSPSAFGVRMAMKPAQPGVFIRIVCALSTVLTTTDNIFCTVQLLGRNIH